MPRIKVEEPVGHVWITKSGKHVPVSKMEDSHLLNAYGLVRRKLRDLAKQESLGYSVYSMLNGDMSTYYMEQELGKVAERIDDLNFWSKVFEQEIRRREILIPEIT